MIFLKKRHKEKKFTEILLTKKKKENTEKKGVKVDYKIKISEMEREMINKNEGN